MKKVYAQRSPLPREPITVVRQELSDGNQLCEIWFMTPGCSYDRSGGCTMCNYGKGYKVLESQVLRDIDSKIKDLNLCNFDLIVNPSGSFLDDIEVPPALRIEMYRLFSDINFHTLTVESRVEMITRKTMEELSTNLPGRKVYIELGIETTNDFLLKHAINKGICLSQMKSSVMLIHEYCTYAIANIGIGIPFISERENIRQAQGSVLKALEFGFDNIILFPYHVKPGTLLEVLFQNRRYSSVSLWSLVETLSGLPSEYLPKVNISWYKNYYTDKRKVIEVPYTCLHCYEEVLGLLDAYKANPCWETLESLSFYRCRCHENWRNAIERESIGLDLERIQDDYRFLANYYDIPSDMLHEAIKELSEDLYD
jgi:radical SAM enzyme (TIGR01210 family)